MKKILPVILAILAAFSFPLNAAAKNDNVKAKSSILMCIDTREVIKESDPYEHLSPASVTKLMSILLILEAIDSGKIKLTDTVAATESAVSKGGSQIWLELGEKMSVDDLFKAVVISSANDACTLLGEYIGGSDSGFVDMMNARAAQLGLQNTHFENCTGLDDEITNHYSCAYDLAVIACEIMEHELITKYSTVWLDSLRGGKTELNNTNKLINKYDGITGLKTGTTSNAGFCLCATAERDGMRLVSVVLGADTSEDRFNLSRQLLDYGFQNYKLEKITVDPAKLTEVKVKNGTVKSVKPTAENLHSVLTAKNSGKLTLKYNIKKSVDAPVKKGDVLGEIIVSADNKKSAAVPLVADRDIDKTSFLFILKKMLNNI